MNLDERVLAFVMAGGRGTRLEVLTRDRSKPAVNILGHYRIIDFVASNVANSGIPIMLVGTQFQPVSLNTHMGNKEVWGFDGRDRHMEILNPYQNNEAHQSFKGTADSVRKNIQRIDRYDPDIVLVLGGDHVYVENYFNPIKTHKFHGSDITIMTTGITIDKVPDFDVLKVNDDGRITGFAEKPTDSAVINEFKLSERARANLGITNSSITHLASMGNYVFSTKNLEGFMKKYPGTDFGNDIIPAIHKDGGEIYVHFFNGYWRDVGKISDYYDCNMEFVNGTPINLIRARIKTYLRDLPGARILEGARIEGGSIISLGDEFYNGSVVRGSVLGYQVIVENNAKVINSILLGADRNDFYNGNLRRDFSTRIGSGSVVNKVIMDKNIQIGQNVHISLENRDYNTRVKSLEDIGLTPHNAKEGHMGDFYLDRESGILVIGKQRNREVLIPDGTRI